MMAMRDRAEITRLMDIRAQRAIDHVTGLAWGKTPRQCPICGYHGMFSPVRHKPEIWCPGCDSRPRHRLLRLWMDRALRLPPNAQILHFAAEPWARAWFEARGACYRSADINDLFDLRLDITAMDLPDSSIDLILANHVLEHVDDLAAMAECWRVLRRGGRLVVTVPMIEGWAQTYENDNLADDTARRLHYGDPDHRRFYGRDFRARMASPGFRVLEFTATEPDVSIHALHRGEKVFIGEKPD